MSIPLSAGIALTAAVLGAFSLQYVLVDIAERVKGWWNTRQMVASDEQPDVIKETVLL
jgi:hypothetical protein